MSRIALRPVRPVSVPSTVTESIEPSQNPFVATLLKVTSVCASNLEASSPPNVISPSFLLSARREILKDVIASPIRPALERDSTGVRTPCSESVCVGCDQWLVYTHNGGCDR